MLAKCLGSLILLYVPYMIKTEFLQFRAAKPKGKYFKNPWNWIDIAGISLTTVITLTTIFGQQWIPA